jgi:hypothetical protein
LTIVSIQAAGLQKDRCGHFFARCPFCQLISNVVLDGRLAEVSTGYACHHALAYTEQVGIGIFLSFASGEDSHY